MSHWKVWISNPTSPEVLPPRLKHGIAGRMLNLERAECIWKSGLVFKGCVPTVILFTSCVIFNEESVWAFFQVLPQPHEAKKGNSTCKARNGWNRFCSPWLTWLTRSLGPTLFVLNCGVSNLTWDPFSFLFFFLFPHFYFILTVFLSLQRFPATDGKGSFGSRQINHI